MSTEKHELFKDHKYINIETYRKNGQGVRTPVWFVIFNKVLYIATTETSGKVKRLKNNKLVKIVPSSFNGTPKGEWMEGHAFFASDDELRMIMSQRAKKYGLVGKIIGKIVSRKGRIIAIGIKI